jgi:hypothetical protein
MFFGYSLISYFIGGVTGITGSGRIGRMSITISFAQVVNKRERRKEKREKRREKREK